MTDHSARDSRGRGRSRNPGGGKALAKRSRSRRRLIEQLEPRLLLAGDPVDQLVNTLVPRLQTSQQQSTALEITPDGDTLVVYNGRGLTDGDGVFVRRIAASGEPLPDRRVNITVNQSQRRPSIATYVDGSYVVSWDGRGPGDHQGIFARWYSADDEPLSEEILINEVIPGGQQWSDIATAANGATLVVWQGTAGAEEPAGVFGRWYSQSGQPLGPQWRINTETAGAQSRPSVDVNAAGQAVVTWSSHDAAAGHWSVYYDTLTAPDALESLLDTEPPTRNERKVSATPLAHQMHSRVGIDGQGNFVVSWSTWIAASHWWDIHARHFAADGSPIDPEDRLVNRTLGGVQKDPALAMSEDGRYAISWTHGQEDGGGWEVVAKTYASGGAVAETDFIVNAMAGDNSGHQSFSAIAIGRGPAQIAWSGSGPIDRRGVWIDRSELAARPRLDPIPDQTLDEHATLGVAASATVADEASEVRYGLEPFSHPLGMVIDPESGLIHWTPGELDGPGEYLPVVLAMDANDPTRVDRQPFRVIVREVNEPPRLEPVPDSEVVEGTHYEVQLRATDPDRPRNGLRFELIDPPVPQVEFDPQSGQLRWQPREADGPAVYAFRARVIDDGLPALHDEVAWNVTVREAATPPTLAPIPDQRIHEQIAWQWTLDADDGDLPRETPLRFTLDAAAENAGIAIDAGGTLRWTPSEAQGPGSYPVSVTVRDGSGLSASQSFRIEVLEVNRPPRLAAIPDQSLQVGERLRYRATADDPDLPPQSLAFQLDADARNRGMTIDPQTGVIEWTAGTPGVHAVEVTVRDNGAPPLSDRERFFIRVGEGPRPPVLEPIGDQEIDELTLLAFDVNASHADEGGEVAYRLGPGAPAGLSLDGTTGELRWVPTEEQGPGLFPVTVFAYDPAAPEWSDAEQFSIVVHEVNVAPRLAPIAPQVIDEGQTVSLRLTASDADRPRNALRYRFADSSTPPEAMRLDSETGQLTWTTTEAHGPGVWLLDVQVYDDGTPSLFDQRSVRIEVRETNRPPVLPPLDDVVIPEMEPWSRQIGGSDPDLPANEIFYALDQASLDAGLSIDASGHIRWTPSEEDGPGTRTVTVQLRDAGQPALSTEATFQIEVLEANRAPQLQPLGPFAVRPGEVVDFTAVASDPDVPSNQLRFALIGDLPPEASLDPETGRFLWQSPSELLPATFDFWVRVEDDGSPPLSDQVPVTIEVLPETLVLREEDRFVTAYEQRIRLREGTTRLRFRFEDLQFDPSDPHSINDAFEAALVDDAGRPLVGIISPDRDAFFNQTEDQSTLLGSGTFFSRHGTRVTVDVDVSHLPAGTELRLLQRLINNDLDEATQVTIFPGVEQLAGPAPADGSLITPAPFAPLVPADPAATTIDWSHVTTVTSAIDFSHDHTVFDTDQRVIGTGLTLHHRGRYPLRGPLLLAISEISLPAVRVVEPTGVITRNRSELHPGTPDRLRGVEYLDLTPLVDGSVLAPGASVRLQLPFENSSNARFTYRLDVLAAINGPPAFTTTAPTRVRLGNTYRYDAAAVDPEADPLRYSLTAGPAGMTIEAATGVVHWQPSAEQLGSHLVTLEVRDPFGLSDTQHFSITVAGPATVNRPPRFISSPVVDAVVGETYLYRARAVDPDFDAVRYEVVAGPAGLEIAAGEAGPRDDAVPVRWIPSAAEAGGTYNVTLRAEDPFGAVARQDYAIRVRADATNLPPVIVSAPATEFRLPEFDLPEEIGAVAPRRIERLLGLGEQWSTDVSVELPPDAFRSTADVVFVVDESSSMVEQSWVADVMGRLDSAFIERGLTDNRYAVVGYGSEVPEPRLVSEQADYEVIIYGGDGVPLDRQRVRAGVPMLPFAVPSDGLYQLAITRHDADLTDGPSPAGDASELLSPFDFQFTAALEPAETMQRSGWGPRHGTLDTAGSTLEFTATAGQLLFVDGIEGEEVVMQLLDPHDRPLAAEQPLRDDLPPMLLRTGGTYRLRLAGPAGAAYRLRLVDPLTDATPHALGTPVTGVLDDPAAAAVYRFASPQQARLFVDRLQSGAAPSLGTGTGAAEMWLVGPGGLLSRGGVETGNSPGLSGSRPHDLFAGTTTAADTVALVLRGDEATEAPIPYRFAIEDLTASAPAVALGAWQSQQLDGPAAAHRLQFEVQDDSLLSLRFDQPAGGSAHWRLLDDHGWTVAAGAVEAGVAIDRLPIRRGGPLRLLLQGDWDNSSAPRFDFRIDAVSGAAAPEGTWATLDEPVLAQFETDDELRYRVWLEQDQSVFASLLHHDSDDVHWRMVAPTGGVLFDSDATAETRPDASAILPAAGPRKLRAPVTGVYELVLGREGLVEEVAFALASIEHDAPWDTPQHGRVEPGGSVEVFQWEATAGQRLQLRSLPRDELFAAAEEAQQRAALLRAQGQAEDGYWAIDFALQHLSFRDSASRQIILLTDEDRDPLRDDLSREVIAARLRDHDATLHAIAMQRIASAARPGAASLGVDLPADADEGATAPHAFFYADEAGGFERFAEGALEIGGSAGTTVEDYLTLAADNGGSAWDLRLLREPPGDAALYRDSISGALVSTLVEDVFRSVDVQLSASDPSAPIEIGAGTIDGNRFTFPVTLRGDGDAWNLALDFIDGEQSGLLYGSVPVALGSAYAYQVRAIDPEGDTIDYRLPAGAEHGARFDPAGAHLTWQPPQPGLYRFTATAGDPAGGLDTQQWTVRVDQGSDNQAPLAEPIAPLRVEVERSLRVVLRASDADGDALVYQLSPNPHDGQLAPTGVTLDPHRGLLTWTPRREQIGAHTLHVRISDGRGGAAIVPLGIEVTPPVTHQNQPPQFTSQPLETAIVDEPYRYPLGAGDADHDPLRFDLAWAPDGMVIDPAVGTVAWRPTASQLGSHPVIIRVQDGQGGVALQEFELQVVARNAAPRVTSAPPAIAAIGEPWWYRPSASDPNGDVVQWRAAPEGLPTGASLDSVAGVLHWTPTAAGVFGFAIVAEDLRGGETEHRFSVEVREHTPPRWLSTALPPAVVGQPWQDVVALADFDSQSAIAAELDTRSVQRGLSLEPIACPPATEDCGAAFRLAWTPTAPGEYAIEITARDEHGLATPQQFDLRVARPAAASGAPRFTSTPRGPAVLGHRWTYQARAIDPEGDALRYQLGDGAPATLEIDPVSGLLQWQVDATGTFEFDIVAEDAHAVSARQRFALPAIERNNHAAPYFVSIPTVRLLATDPWTYHARAADPGGDRVRYRLDDASLEAGLTIDASTGSVRWERPVSGSQPITVTAVDPWGLATTQTFTLRVDPPANRPPRIRSTATGPLFVGTRWQYTPEVFDADGDPLQFRLGDAQIPPGLSLHRGTGRIEWTADNVGELSVELIVTDGRGGTASQSIALPIEQSPPQQSPLFTTRPAGHASLGAPWSYAAGVMHPQGKGVRFTLDPASHARGLELDAASGRLHWLPDSLAEQTVRLTAIDEDGAVAHQQFTIRVAAANQPPRIESLPRGPVFRGQPWEYQLEAFDADGDPLQYLLDNAAQADGWSIDTTGLLSGTPTTLGQRPITISVVDPQGAVANQEIALQVIERPEFAQLSPQFRSLPPRTARLDEVLLHHAFAWSPAQPHAAVHYALADAPAGMRIEQKTGALSWLPPRTGAFDVRIIATDAEGRTSAQSFVIEVLAGSRRNQPPKFVSEPPLPAARDVAYRYRLQVEDDEADALQWSLDAASEQRGITLSSSGVLEWLPVNSGPFPITVTVSDRWGATAVQSYTLVVLENAPPRFEPLDSRQVPLGTELDQTVTAFDANEDNLRFELVAGPEGAVLDAQNGVLHWRADELGPQTFELRVTDRAGASDQLRWTVFAIDPEHNTAPRALSAPPQKIRFDHDTRVQLEAVDDEGDRFSWSLVTAPSGVSLSPRGLFHWRPTTTQQTDAEPHLLHARLTDHRGAIRDVHWSIRVRPTDENEPPRIVDRWQQAAVAERLWETVATAVDPDGDELRWLLNEGPAGMWMEPSGRLRWEPGPQDVGMHPVTVIVHDPLGGSDQASFTLTVRGTNSPALIDGNPPLHHRAGTSYTTQFTATDADEDRVRFVWGATDLTHGAVLDPDTGRLDWLPSDHGEYAFAVRATDPFGGASELQFTVVVDAFGPNDPPEFLPTPPGVADGGATYQRPFPAEDPDGDGLVYTVEDGPGGMRIDEDGLLTWSAPAELIGQSVEVLLGVADPAGNFGRYQFALPVVPPNVPPRVRVAPRDTVVAGQLYRDDLRATDENGDALAFELVSGPDGFAVDELTGRLRWQTAADNIAAHSVVVAITDHRIDEPLRYEFTVDVVADQQPPDVEIVAEPTVIPVGRTVTVRLMTGDDVGVESRSLQLAGTALQLDPEGFGEVTLDSVGRYTLHGRAVDAAGNIGEATLELLVFDPDNESPEISLLNPFAGAAVTDLQPVRASIADPEQQLREVTVWLSDAAAQAEPILLNRLTAPADGYLENLANAVVAELDPTLLENGRYRLTVRAEDAGLNRSERTIPIRVDGMLKLGSYQVSFVDLRIELAGLPLEIRRTYQSLRHDQPVDFGLGWELGLNATQLSVDAGTLGGGATGRYRPFVRGTRVEVRLPNGTSEGFTFEPRPLEEGGSLFLPHFVADPGSSLRLQSPQHLLRASGARFITEDGVTYNPADPEIGNFYELADREASVQTFRASDSRLLKLTDRNGNALRVEDDGVQSSTGTRVDFERDHRGRIAAVVDPRGNRVTYHYDAQDRLRKVIDREQNTRPPAERLGTELNYDPAHPTRLAAITDPEGVVLFAGTLDPQGRLVSQRGAGTAEVHSEFDIAGRVQRTYAGGALLGQTTFDAWGRLESLDDYSGASTTLEFGESGKPEAITRLLRDAETGEVTETFRYPMELDEQGRVLSRTTPDGQTTRYIYDPETGHLVGEVDALGNRTSFTFDEAGNLSSTTGPDKQGIRYERDARGNITAAFAFDASAGSRGDCGDEEGGGPGQENICFAERLLFAAEFDESGREISRTDSFGQQTLQQYDANHNLVSSQTTIFAETPNRRVIERSIDANDQPRQQAERVVTAAGAVERSLEVERTFDASGRLVGELSNDGRSTWQEHDAEGRPTVVRSVSAQGATQVSYRMYDAEGRLALQTDPVDEGNEPVTGKRYRYDPAGQLTRTDTLVGLRLAIDRSGGRPAVRLLDSGRVLPGAAAAPDGLNYPAEIATEDGRSVERRRDHLGRTIETITTVRDPDGGPQVRIERRAYDAYGRLLTATDPVAAHADGPATGVRYVYDTRGQQIRTDRVSGLQIDIVERADGTWESVVTSAGDLIDNDRLQFDGAGRLRERRETDGSVTRLGYDPRGRVTERIVEAADTDAREEIRLTIYEDDRSDGLRGIVELSPLRPADIGAPTTARRTLRDAAGRVHSVEYLTGVVAEVQPLAGGRRGTSLVQPGEVIGREVTIYDPVGRVIRKRNAWGGQRDFEFDALGNTVAVTGEAYFDIDLGESVRPRSAFVFDGTRKLAEIHGLRLLADGTINDEQQQRTEYGYDERGRRVATTLPDGSVVRIEYNALGQVVAEIDPAGQTTRYEYNENGAVSAMLLPRSNAALDGRAYHPRTEYEYDDWGNRVVSRTGIIEWPDGSRDDSAARTIRDRYDAAGNLLEVVRPEQLAEQRSYDNRGRISTITRPDGSIEHFRWSDDTLDPGLVETSYFTSADAFARGEPNAFTRHERVSDRLAIQHYEGGEIRRHRDADGQLRRVETPGGTIDYQYDAFGRLSSAATREGADDTLRQRVVYQYDAAGRLAEVALTHRGGSALQGEPSRYRYAYDALGRVRRVMHPDGMLELYEYDPRGRTAAVRYLLGDATPEDWSDNAPLASFEYTFGADGHRETVDERFWDPHTGALSARAEHWLTHDGAGRLVEHRRRDAAGDRSRYFLYDSAHNRVSEKLDWDRDGSIEWRRDAVYDLADRLRSTVEYHDGVAFAETTYSYAEGASVPHHARQRELATDQILSETEFTYDLRGYLVARRDSSRNDEGSSERLLEQQRGPAGELFAQRQRLVRDGATQLDESLHLALDFLSPSGHDQVFEAWDAVTGASHTGVVSGHRVLAEATGAQPPASLLADAVGSTRRRGRALSWSDPVHYSSFGRPAESLPTLHGYAGELQDAVHHQVHLRRRTYHPGLGRFLQADTFSGFSGEPTSLNRYTYASNAPFTYTDPSGNIFVLIDGTWNHDDPAYLNEGEDFTNVVKLREAYAALGQGLPFAYYRGVGNPVDNSAAASLLGGAFGLGLGSIAEEALQETLNTLQDRSGPVFVAGFSRGSIAAIHFAHLLSRVRPELPIQFMGLFDPVASIGFPGNGINIGYNLSLPRNVRSGLSLISWQEDRGFFPGTNFLNSRMHQEALYGVHGDVGGGYAHNTELLDDALFTMTDAFNRNGLRMRKDGAPCPLCNENSANSPHPLNTYLMHGGRTYYGLGRPMIEHPMPGELGLAYFTDHIELGRINPSEAEIAMATWMWIPLYQIRIGVIALAQSAIPYVGAYSSAAYRAWNLAALHVSHLQYFVNRI